MPQPPSETVLTELLKKRLFDVETKLNADCVCLFGPILYGVEQRFNNALTVFPSRRDALAVILDTPGGVVEVAERMVQSSRHYYKEVYFIVPNQAMSAGTVFAMSGDKILMNYFSVLV